MNPVEINSGLSGSKLISICWQLLLPDSSTSCRLRSLETLSSDQLPILIRLQKKTPSKPGLRRTYVNLKKDNWDRYRQEVEATMSKRSLLTDRQRDEKIVRTVLLKSISHHIPTGRTDSMRILYQQRC